MWSSGAGRRVQVACVAGAMLALSGCGNFFTKPTSGGGGSGGGSTTGTDRIYALATTTQTISGFTVGASTLTAVPGNAFSPGFAPLAAVVARSGKYLYVAAPGAVYVYTIATDGSLSAGTAVAIATTAVSLDVSPDGLWLFGLDATTQALDEWKINSDGTLATQAPVQYTPAAGTWVPKAIKVAPSGAFIVAAVGTAGDVTFTLNTATGVTLPSLNRSVDTAQSSDNALVIDSTSTHVYVARSGAGGGVMSFTITGQGVLTAVTGSPFVSGSGASSVAIEGTGKYLYVANRGDSTISGYLIAADGTLAALTGSPFAAGSLVSSIGVDSSGKYLLAAAFGGSPDLAMYSFDTTVPGKLISVATRAIGAAPTGASLVTLTP